jgi:predicted ABC-type transport system involved in lysophospholipase L1 biosynthesis ATPase subunit
VTGVVVTHNEKLAESLGRRVRLLAGRLAEGCERTANCL